MKKRIPAKMIKEGDSVKIDLTPWNRKNLETLKLSLVGKDVWLSIEKQTKNRSIPQNNYLWGVVYKIIADETGMDVDSVHHWAKSEFLMENGGSISPIKKVQSTKKLKTTEFNEYVEELIRWAAEFLSVFVPLPNEEEMWGDTRRKNQKARQGIQ